MSNGKKTTPLPKSLSVNNDQTFIEGYRKEEVVSSSSSSVAHFEEYTSQQLKKEKDDIDSEYNQAILKSDNGSTKTEQ